MKYGICNETFGDWDLNRALQFAAEAGYHGWEVAPFMLTDDIRSYGDAQRRAYRDAVHAAGMEVIGLHWLLAKTEGYHLTSTDPRIHLETVEYFRDLIRLCADLDGEVMVLGSPQQRNVPEGESMVDATAAATVVLQDISPTLEECGVKIALEPLGPQEGNFLNTAAEARELIELVGSDHVGLHLDVKAMSSEADPIPDIIHDNADVTLHFHANDPNLLGPGMGDVDFRPIFQALKDAKYDRYVSVEVFDYSPGVERIVRESMDNMRTAQN
ncbi:MULTISPECIES: sugar phosphate isomerase/epimerase family protein [Crateriforma]|uniref:Inosose isomerase n=1 Tax=Crateriforma conspicua TaxID=2527996 RepID=A0A5C6FI86_9PLAN|nr:MULTISPECIES: sugar phosphate isomerase/epimerase family protein [Crateriforma]TWU61810.1 Inosose isomerase [Crateriforma conspicua]